MQTYYTDRNGICCRVPRKPRRPPAPKGPVRRCELCGHVGPSTRHHLVPQAVGGRGETCCLCPECHGFVHRMFTVRQLQELYYTLELLASAPEVGTFVSQVRGTPPAD